MNKICFLLIFGILGSCKTTEFIFVEDDIKGEYIDIEKLQAFGICNYLINNQYRAETPYPCEAFFKEFTGLVSFPYGNETFLKNMNIIQVASTEAFVTRKDIGTVLIFLEIGNKLVCKSRMSGILKGYFISYRKYSDENGYYGVPKGYPNILVERLIFSDIERKYYPQGYTALCVYRWKNDTYVLKSVLNCNGGLPIDKETYNSMFSELNESTKRDSL